jgi:hypothetical protein
MPRQKVSVSRPPCPFGHRGDVWLDGFYAKGTDFERPRFRCQPRRDPATGQRPTLHPDGRKPHKFIEPLARRHPTAANPRAGGRRCETCERTLDRHEGPQTPRGHVFSIHEAARLLVEVGKGTSFRGSSRTTRRDANRLSRTLFGRLIPSAHGQLAQDYLAAFAPVVLDAFAPPDHWPDAIVLDSKPIPFTLTTRHPNGTITSQQAAYHLLGIHGYPAGRGSGRPWRIFVAGGADGVEWEKVLRSLPGTPSWVVCDDDKGIKAAVRSLWPKAVIHTCEGHLRRLLLDRLVADGQSPNSPLALRAGGALADPAKWATFVAEANATGLAHTSHWLAGKDRLMARQFAARQADPPYSNGAIETVFDALTKRLWTRRFVFRNRARLEVALRLMLLDVEGVADELRYREAIRKALLAGGGQPAWSRRSLDDRGGSSIHAEVRAVIARTAAKRAQNARHARASYSRKRAAGVSRTRPRSARRLRATRSP